MMKATGIVRRIDDLGRVVIPKEIRRTLRIHEGDPLELFTCETPNGKRGVCFEPYETEKDAMRVFQELQDIVTNEEWGREVIPAFETIRKAIKAEQKRREEDV